MSYDVTKLHAALRAASLPVASVSGSATGRIDWLEGPTDEQRAQAEAIKAAHDPSPSYAERRAAEYPSADALVVALWEHIVEGRPAGSEALQKLRAEVKARHPKPG